MKNQTRWRDCKTRNGRWAACADELMRWMVGNNRSPFLCNFSRSFRSLAQSFSAYGTKKFLSFAVCTSVMNIVLGRSLIFGVSLDFFMAKGYMMISERMRRDNSCRSVGWEHVALPLRSSLFAVVKAGSSSKSPSKLTRSTLSSDSALPRQRRRSKSFAAWTITEHQ